ncbi:zinc ribbon domain-containing protein [Candidatus Bathyarchaeota archaeon]|nr:zinc ribbon domain-containing protein [Candidatus Bathyarchaeota archaeon]MBS7631486.1 zinc ribbon domain-containing protein [Candidatus Bathyarchaeota archaeon]
MDYSVVMVYCSICGEQNPDDREYCSKCGGALHPERSYRRIQRSEKSPFYPLRGVGLWLFLGLLIILWGVTEIVSEFFRIRINFLALVAIIFGAIIIAGAVKRL